MINEFKLLSRFNFKYLESFLFRFTVRLRMYVFNGKWN